MATSPAPAETSNLAQAIVYASDGSPLITPSEARAPEQDSQARPKASQEAVTQGASSSHLPAETSDLAQVLEEAAVQEMSNGPPPNATSNLAQVLVEAVTPQVVGDLVAAFRLELASLIPVLLAPLAEEMRDLKNQSTLHYHHHSDAHSHHSASQSHSHHGAHHGHSHHSADHGHGHGQHGAHHGHGHHGHGHGHHGSHGHSTNHTSHHAQHLDHRDTHRHTHFYGPSHDEHHGQSTDHGSSHHSADHGHNTDSAQNMDHRDTHRHTHFYGQALGSEHEHDHSHDHSNRDDDGPNHGERHGDGSPHTSAGAPRVSAAGTEPAATEDAQNAAPSSIDNVAQGFEPIVIFVDNTSKHRQKIATPTINSPAIPMEIGMSTPLVDPCDSPWEASLLGSWRHLSGHQSQPAREGYRLTPQVDDAEVPRRNRGSLSRASFASRASFCSSVTIDHFEDMKVQQRATVHDRLKMAQDNMRAGKVEVSWIVKTVTSFLEDPDSSSAAMYYSQFIIAFSIFSILVGLLPYVGLTIPLSFEVVIDSILCLEILVRGMFCPNVREFLSNYANMIDSLSSVPLAVIFLMQFDVCEAEWGNAFLLSAVPVIRILRFVRRFPKMQILITAFKDCLEALPVLLYTLAVMGVIFTSAIFLVEPRDNVSTLSESAWLVISTISTVGYGDITPSTKSGAALASILMIISQLYMAMPFGIIGYNFTVIWEHRAQILLLNSTRDRLAKQGFSAYEIPRLFELFDLDGSAEFDMEEFQLLFKELDIGFKEDDIMELFKLIDKDAGGTVDEKEFVRAVYPNEYRYVYAKHAKKQEKDPEEQEGEPEDEAEDEPEDSAPVDDN